MIMKDVQCKILFSESDAGDDQYIECRGSRMSSITMFYVLYNIDQT